VTSVGAVHIKLRPAEIEKQLADLAITQSIQAMTQSATENHCGQSINEERRLAQFPLTLDQVAGAPRFIVELIVQFHSHTPSPEFKPIEGFSGR
jgi:hypothetical protein